MPAQPSYTLCVVSALWLLSLLPGYQAAASPGGKALHSSPLSPWDHPLARSPASERFPSFPRSMVLLDMDEPETLITVDAISRETARIETARGICYEIPAAWLPAKAREGTVLTLSCTTEGETSTLSFACDHIRTGDARNRIRSKLDKLRSRNP
ncbi:Protein of unknown function [Alkalispirochaeta americana]|uniref:Uncharacterized protein n=1 Tax=Alkalispirochaeta americana TaxID=159291 RepID=A0A1N6S4Z3_9SPIO|nr:DUF3006 domain-containing protein [Alkalispirochaeta americana]SIQ36193.1 Protein of unknown function [Alkalispirochaeta americana]